MQIAESKIDDLLEVAEAYTKKIIQSSMSLHIQHKKAQKMQKLNMRQSR